MAELPVVDFTGMYRSYLPSQCTVAPNVVVAHQMSTSAQSSEMLIVVWPDRPRGDPSRPRPKGDQHFPPRPASCVSSVAENVNDFDF